MADQSDEILSAALHGSPKVLKFVKRSEVSFILKYLGLSIPDMSEIFENGLKFFKKRREENPESLGRLSSCPFLYYIIQKYYPIVRDAMRAKRETVVW